ncbi:amino acid ABC transporter permease [Salipiger pallidus]|uniref:Amino acid ABC transporter permease n=1 Tax=Salipiger pallidus TaxID=1775170 RepID=A0A8J3EGG8_9RHOB|nr:amino acid ABC transporter permease [Salipiger pallidus]GGG76404.1 amino acid ABC transporter permease [Salipiger pallidus]
MSFDPTLIVEAWPQLMRGLETTVWLFLAVMILCTPLSLLVALARLSRRRWLSRAAGTYVNVIRALPLLVILFFTFYGLPSLGIFVSPFTAALGGMVLVTTAYLAEDLRAGLMAVPRGQFEAADALGLPQARFVRRVLIPQALPIMCGPYFTRAIVTVKATSIASLVAVSELTSASMAKVTETYRAMEYLAFAAVAYILLSALIAVVQAVVQRRVRLP